MLQIFFIKCENRIIEIFEGRFDLDFLTLSEILNALFSLIFIFVNISFYIFKSAKTRCKIMKTFINLKFIVIDVINTLMFDLLT